MRRYIRTHVERSQAPLFLPSLPLNASSPGLGFTATTTTTTSFSLSHFNNRIHSFSTSFLPPFFLVFSLRFPFIFFFAEGEMKMEGKQKREEEDGYHKVDLSGLSLESLQSSSLNLAGVTKLDLSNNNLENIPESLTARLLNVVVLDVHSNQLRTLPNSMGCLSKLKVLNISGNLIESLPKSIEDCRALEELIANFNKLTKLPETMGFELINLKKLSVNSNRLAFLPYSTSHLTSLRVLDARLNCLRSLPDGLENLIRLEVLNVSQNFQYLQSLPYSIGLLVSLTELDISYNKITILPDSIGCLTKLRKLEAMGNPLVCPPMEVVEHSVEAVREYLSSRMNRPPTGPPPSLRKGTWFGKLVKCGTFSGAIMPNHSLREDNNNGFSLSEYRSIDGLATPRYAGMFSPRRLFSPRRSSSHT